MALKTDKEVAAEALRRAGALKRENEKRRRARTSVAATVAGLALVVALALYVPGPLGGAGDTPANTYSATLFADGSAGGYVLVGVVAFVLGAAVVLVCTRKPREK